MARRSMKGQLNMFDFIKSLETMPEGDVEMVSLMPAAEVEPKVELEPKVEVETKVEVEPKVEVKTKVEVEPEVEIEPVVEVEPVEVEKEPVKVVIKPEPPVMSRSYDLDGEHIEIAYLKYNKVRIKKGEAEPEIKVFDSSKEAVDYYVEQMQELEADE